MWPIHCDLLVWVGLSRTKKVRYPVFSRGCQHSNRCWILRSKWWSHYKPFLKKNASKTNQDCNLFFQLTVKRKTRCSTNTENKSSMRNIHPKEKTWLTLRLFICFLSKHAHWSPNSWTQVFCKEVGPESPPFITAEINPFPCMSWWMFFQLSKANVYCFFIYFPPNSWFSGSLILNIPENETYKLWLCSWPRSEQWRGTKLTLKP